MAVWWLLLVVFCAGGADQKTKMMKERRLRHQGYRKADLSIKDHLLIFRTFMVLKDADAAKTSSANSVHRPSP